MRLKLSFNAFAIVFTSKVFASPGTPSSKQCPPARKAMIISSITSSCPIITFCISFFNSGILAITEFTFDSIGSNYLVLNLSCYLNPIVLIMVLKKAFSFTRLRYHSGDWDTDQRMPANLLNSLIEYTRIQVETKEQVIDLESNDLFNAPFCYLSGHKLVEFSRKEAENFKRYVLNGGFIFVDDCNHDIDGLFAKSFESQMHALFGAGAIRKIPANHAIYHSFFNFDKGPPTTSFEQYASVP